jgi:hypothetical protein
LSFVIRHSVLVLVLLIVACASRPAPPATTRVDVPVTPPPTAREEKAPDAETPPTRPVAPIREETLGTPSAPTLPPPPAIERKTIADRLAERDLPPRRKAALALVGEATELLAKRQIDAAVRRLENAIGIDPAAGYAYYYLALVRAEQMRYDQALALCGQAYLKLGGDAVFRAKALALRARVHLAQGERAKAVRDVDSALALDPECADALALKARLTP